MALQSEVQAGKSSLQHKTGTRRPPCTQPTLNGIESQPPASPEHGVGVKQEGALVAQLLPLPAVLACVVGAQTRVLYCYFVSTTDCPLLSAVAQQKRTEGKCERVGGAAWRQGRRAVLKSPAVLACMGGQGRADMPAPLQLCGYQQNRLLCPLAGRCALPGTAQATRRSATSLCNRCRPTRC